MKKTHYTFGDTDAAELRLRLFAQTFEPSSRLLLQIQVQAPPAHALDVGCGPGHTTALVQATTGARRVTGIDQSPRFIEAARAAAKTAGAEQDFHVHNALEAPYPVGPVSLLYCRALLTHLATPETALQRFSEALAPGGLAVLEEVKGMISAEPALQRYYALVAALQSQYGQKLNMGDALPALIDPAHFCVRHSAEVPLRLQGTLMPQLHHLNIATWKRDPKLAPIATPAELDQLESELEALLDRGGADVTCTLRQMVLERV